jgi:hypothetical protein
MNFPSTGASMLKRDGNKKKKKSQGDASDPLPCASPVHYAQGPGAPGPPATHPQTPSTAARRTRQGPMGSENRDTFQNPGTDVKSQSNFFNVFFSISPSFLLRFVSSLAAFSVVEPRGPSPSLFDASPPTSFSRLPFHPPTTTFFPFLGPLVFFSHHLWAHHIIDHCLVLTHGLFVSRLITQPRPSSSEPRIIEPDSRSSLRNLTWTRDAPFQIPPPFRTREIPCVLRQGLPPACGLRQNVAQVPARPRLHAHRLQHHGRHTSQ